MRASIPLIEIHNRQRKTPVDLPPLKHAALRALPLCLAVPGPGRRPLARLRALDVSLVSDRAIARIHARFLGAPTPTDVITFHDGDIIVSAETARRQGEQLGTSTLQEILLYVIHAMLHLNGHDDHSTPDRRRMTVAQRRILRACLPLLSPPDRKTAIAEHRTTALACRGR